MAESRQRIKPVLDPTERVSEILFGLIMVLTITCSLKATGAVEGDVRTMLVAAIGCNLAWGIIDAVFYVMACISEHGHNRMVIKQLRAASDSDKGRRIIAEAIPPALASMLLVEELENLRRKAVQISVPDTGPWPTIEDWRGAFGVFLLVFLSTFPVVVPFLFVHKLSLALRISNAVAFVMLFAAGWAFGLYAGGRPWRVGLGMVLVGFAMVGITIALGG
jgi:VIT1/CCC1 family predicted Fe2+/Mn2+ transporter